MQNAPFIFGNDRANRLKRHFAFWASWWIFQSFLYSFVAGFNLYAYRLRLPLSAVESLLFMTAHAFLAYSLMYGVIPKLLLKGRYWETVLVVPLLFIGTGALSALISLNIVVPMRVRVFGELDYQPHANEVHFYLGLLAGLRGAITIGGLAAAIKLMKYWYSKEQRNLQLQNEALDAQMQLLKAQVHPHFLFNTLNNIYAQTQEPAPAAARMIAGLSDLLRYMLYEGSQAVVPLHEELKMLRDYLLLEKIRYGNKLDLSISLPDDTGDLHIAPLLLLPYVENCFKHGASHILEQPWISLQVHIEGDVMKLKLVNAKPEEPLPTAPGIGMKNVARRLELLYPDRHQLQVVDAGEVFIVNLKLQLDRQVLASRNAINRHASTITG